MSTGIDYVIIVEQYIDKDRTLRNDWDICLQVANLRCKEDLQRLAYHWLAEHGYHKLKHIQEHSSHESIAIR